MAGFGVWVKLDSLEQYNFFSIFKFEISFIITRPFRKQKNSGSFIFKEVINDIVKNKNLKHGLWTHPNTEV